MAKIFILFSFLFCGEPPHPKLSQAVCVARPRCSGAGGEPTPAGAALQSWPIATEEAGSVQSGKDSMAVRPPDQRQYGRPDTGPKTVWPSGPSAWAAILRSRAGPARCRKAKKAPLCKGSCRRTPTEGLPACLADDAHTRHTRSIEAPGASPPASSGFNQPKFCCPARQRSMAAGAPRQRHAACDFFIDF